MQCHISSIIFGLFLNLKISGVPWANSSVIRQKNNSPNGCFKKNKACQVFRKTNFSYPLIRTRACSYQGVRNVCFQKIWPALFFLKHPFRDSPFLPYLRRILWIYRIIHLMFQRKYSHEQIWFEIHNFKKFQNSNFIILRNGLENILITR